MKAIVFAIMASLVWGMAPPIFKLVLKAGIPPSVALIFHNLAAFSAALLITFLLGEKMVYSPKHFLFAMLGGVMSGFLGLYLFFLALKRGDVSVVSPIASISPLWSAIFAHLALGEGLSPVRVLGIILVIAGASLLMVSLQR
ncbi:MAG: EamA family transporter [Aquificaceae bacterium]